MPEDSQRISRQVAAALLRRVGLRKSESRLAVLQGISGADAPVSHGEMIEKLSDLEFDAATIYRCLNDLADAGLLMRMVLGDHTFRFEFHPIPASELPSSVTHPRHPHFFCTDCGRIVCLEHRDALTPAELRQIAARAGEVTEILFKGHCFECSEEPTEGSEEP